MANEKRGRSTDDGAEAASGSVERPIAPDDAQPGDRFPVDVFPAKGRGGIDHPTPDGGAPAQKTETGKRGN